MVTVDVDEAVVESDLVEGRLACPSCRVGTLGPWGWARTRTIGRRGVRRRVRPRRSRCRGCRVTHVLLGWSWLLRRADAVAVVGAALLLRMSGMGVRPIAAAVGAPRSTVRGWLTRFDERAERVRVHLWRWALWTDPGLVRIDPAGSRFADAVAACVTAGEAIGVRLGMGRWETVAAVTSGRLLCNTSSPFPAPWTG